MFQVGSAFTVAIRLHDKNSSSKVSRVIMILARFLFIIIIFVFRSYRLKVFSFNSKLGVFECLFFVWVYYKKSR